MNPPSTAASVPDGRERPVRGDVGLQRQQRDAEARSAMPAHENGTIERPSSASSRLTAPSRPGQHDARVRRARRRSRGCPRRNSSVIRLGSSRISRSRSCSGSSCALDACAGQCKRQVLATASRPSIFASSAGGRGHEVDDVPGSASSPVQLRGQRGQAAARRGDRALRERRVAAAARSRGSASGPGVVDQLAAQIAADVAPPMSIGVAAPGVGGRHHGREIGGLQHHEARAGRARAARATRRPRPGLRGAARPA